MKDSTKRRAVGGLAAAAVAAVAFTPASAGAACHDDDPNTPQLSLREPGGENRVGSTTLHLVDENRADPWVPEERRELMTTLWYPTEGTGEAASYMTVEESELFLARQLEGSPFDVPLDLLAGVETNSVAGVEPSAGEGELPLVVLSPGYSFPRATLAGLGEELASRGYVVAAVGHNYEAPISFPGRTTECLTCGNTDIKRVSDTRGEDLSFVLDELTGDDAVWEHAGVIDEERAMVGGHSVGGSGSHRAMSIDDRFDAGFNLDGTFFGLSPQKIDRPFLLVGNDDQGFEDEDKSRYKAWKRLDGWKRWLRIDDTSHSAWTDLAPLREQAGLPSDHLPGAYLDEMARVYLTAFADRHMKGEEAPIFDGPSEEWPEVEFHNP
ncbi:alpha/beta hydrolase [Salininema proteolyticum]|uniref:Alpha/beta hydrolase n=1 Tax=Salininema proteolyticum TaxID=1607685 RepID=A0ABV8U4T3_9ACTN